MVVPQCVLICMCNRQGQPVQALARVVKMYMNQKAQHMTDGKRKKDNRKEKENKGKISKDHEREMFDHILLIK